MKQWMPLLRTWILPIAILLGLNVAFLSPAYLSGDILDQDDIKLGYAKTKKFVNIAKSMVKSRFGQIQCLVACRLPKFLPDMRGIFMIL